MKKRVKDNTVAKLQEKAIKSEILPRPFTPFVVFLTYVSRWPTAVYFFAVLNCKENRWWA
jgi:hypothetical protein